MLYAHAEEDKEKERKRERSTREIEEYICMFALSERKKSMVYLEATQYLAQVSVDLLVLDEFFDGVETADYSRFAR